MSRGSENPSEELRAVCFRQTPQVFSSEITELAALDLALCCTLGTCRRGPYSPRAPGLMGEANMEAQGAMRTG